MAYCTVSDVIHELHPTLKLQMEQDWGDNFEDILLSHILKAEAYVNSSLARAYSVPLKKAAYTVISAECKIAAYYAVAAYSEKEEILKDKYEIAKEILDNLVEANNPSLVDEGLSDEDKNKKLKVRYGSNAQIFTSDELELW